MGPLYPQEECNTEGIYIARSISPKMYGNQKLILDFLVSLLSTLLFDTKIGPSFHLFSYLSIHFLISLTVILILIICLQMKIETIVTNGYENAANNFRGQKGSKPSSCIWVWMFLDVNFSITFQIQRSVHFLNQYVVFL